jgi:hypothetical protein
MRIEKTKPKKGVTELVRFRADPFTFLGGFVEWLRGKMCSKGSFGMAYEAHNINNGSWTIV